MRSRALRCLLPVVEYGSTKRATRPGIRDQCGREDFSPEERGYIGRAIDAGIGYPDDAESHDKQPENSGISLANVCSGSGTDIRHGSANVCYWG